MAVFTSFKGNNKLKTRQIFIERAKYETGIFDEIIPAKPITKFYTGEYQFYGKVDETLDSVVVDTKKLKSISNTERSYVALDFVAEQYKKMSQNFNKCYTVGTISKTDPFLSLIKPYRAYQSFDTSWENYIKKVIIAFNKDYIVAGNRLKSVVDFTTYMNNMIDFGKLASKTLPLTKETFLKTKLCAMNVSGLVIEIADLDYSDDNLKFEFLNSPNFEFYKNVCIKYGFMIDFNVPWRLIADIDSPSMVEAMEKLGYDRETIFTSHFQKARLNEISNIKNTLFAGYSMLIKNRPFTEVVYECKSKLRTTIINRSQISKSDVNLVIDDKMALDIFIMLRASEQENILSNQYIESLKSKSYSYLNNLSLQDAIDFVDEEFKINQLTNSGTLNTRIISINKSKQEG